MTARLTLTGVVMLMLTTTIIWAFGISLPDWLPLVDFFGTGDWSILKSLILIGAVLFGGGALWGGFVYIKDGGSAWSKRFFILSAVVGLSTLLGYVVMTGTGLDALLYILEKKREVQLQPLIEQADKLRAGKIKPEDIDLFDFFTGLYLLAILVGGMILVGLFTGGGKEFAQSVSKNAGLIITLLLIGFGLWLLFGDRVSTTHYNTNRGGVSAPVKPQTAVIMRPAYDPNTPVSGPFLSKASYLTQEVGAWNYRVSARWGDGITNWRHTCIDWYNFGIEIGSRVGISGKFYPGLVDGYTQVAFRSKNGALFTTQIDRKPAGTC